MQQDLNYINSYRPYQPMEYQPQNQFQQMNQQVPQTALQAAQTQNMNQPSNFTRTQQNVFVRAVTGREEAIAAQIPLDGSIVAFTDFAHKKIYTKQINLDGTATLNTYVLQENPEPIPTSAPAPIERQEDLSGYVKQDELEAVCRSFTQQISGLEAKIREYEDLLNHIEEPAPKTRTTSSTSRETKTGGTRK